MYGPAQRYALSCTSRSAGASHPSSLPTTCRIIYHPPVWPHNRRTVPHTNSTPTVHPLGHDWQPAPPTFCSPPLTRRYVSHLTGTWSQQSPPTYYTCNGHPPTSLGTGRVRRAPIMFRQSAGTHATCPPPTIHCHISRLTHQVCLRGCVLHFRTL